MTPTPSIQYTGFSFTGRRSINQDSILLEKINDDTFLFAVADGMGGHKGGEIASRIAVAALLDTVKKEIKHHNNLKLILKKAFEASDQRINAQTELKPELSGMGTTLVCLLIHKDNYVYGNIGDSRLYFLKNDVLTQISEDHSYINDFEKKTGNVASVAMAGKYGHLLTRCLDGNNSIPDIYPPDKNYLKLVNNTCFMLCSDGLINDRINTNNTLFKNYLLGEDSIEKSAKNLIGHAFYSGSNDNISIIIIDVGLKKNKKLKLKQYNYPPADIDKRNFLSKLFNW